MKGLAAIIGGGVIGGGWAARFLLNGWDVNLFDPDPAATGGVQEVLSNARRSLPGLVDRDMPPEGELNVVPSIEQALTNADWVQESVPERLELKHKVLAQIQQAVSPQAVVASSTSGFRPSVLYSLLRNA